MKGGMRSKPSILILGVILLTPGCGTLAAGSAGGPPGMGREARGSPGMERGLDLSAPPLTASARADLPGQNAVGGLFDRLFNGGKEPLKGKQPAEKGDLVVFTAVDPVSKEGRMFVWDEEIQDAYALPAVGNDLNPGGTFYLGNHIAFERKSGGIFSYDLQAETISAFNDVNQTGFATRPSITGDGAMMTFVSNVDGASTFRPVVTRGFIWMKGVVAELPKVNETADQHGGLARVRLAGKGGGTGTFCTLDGAVFVFDVFSGAITEITAVRTLLDGFGHHPVLSGDGKRLAFVVGRKSPQQIFVMDLKAVETPAGKIMVPAGNPEPLVYANAVVDTPVATSPRFTGSGRIYFEAQVNDQGIFKAFRYDPVNGVQMLTVLNSTVPDESTVFAGTGVP